MNYTQGTVNLFFSDPAKTSNHAYAQSISEQGDCALIAEIVRRQSGALERLYEHYHMVVYHLAFKI